MKAIKFVGIFLAILLLVFMIKGMLLGAMFFFYILKLFVIAAVISGVILFFVLGRKK